MRPIAALGMPLVLVALGAALAADDSKDKDQILGTWQVSSMELGGNPAPEDATKEVRFEFTADKMILSGMRGPEKREYTYKLDPTTKPKAIDTSPLDGPFKGKTGPAIYELDGDTLKLCIPNKETKDRPSEFKSPKGSQLGLFVLKRVKP